MAGDALARPATPLELSKCCAAAALGMAAHFGETARKPFNCSTAEVLCTRPPLHCTPVTDQQPALPRSLPFDVSHAHRHQRHRRCAPQRHSLRRAARSAAERFAPAGARTLVFGCAQRKGARAVVAHAELDVDRRQALLGASAAVVATTLSAAPAQAVNAANVEVTSSDWELVRAPRAIAGAARSPHADAARAGGSGSRGRYCAAGHRVLHGRPQSR